MMTGQVKLCNGKLKTVRMSKEEWKRHSKGLKEVNSYNTSHNRKIYKGQDAIDLVAGWVYDAQCESYCDGLASLMCEYD